MQAFILAGGLGTRLRSVVNDRPKALAPIGSTPFLEHQLMFLRDQQITEFVFCVGYRHGQIREYFGNGERWGVSIAYSVEDEPLGTAGALKHAGRLARGAFLALNGDTFVDLDVQSLRRAHQSWLEEHGDCLATVALTETDDPRSYGSVSLEPDGTITAFREKDVADTDVRYINAGAYVLEPGLLDLVPAGRSVSLERETFPAAIAGGRGQLHGFSTSCFLIDIGTPDGYHRFQTHVGGTS